MAEKNTFSISELQQKANDGDAQAQFELALCYANGTDLLGKGVAKNYELAMEWFDKAATQGHIEAKNLLAEHYYHIANNLYFGENGFENNVELAFEWCTKAAELGHICAYLLLGNLYTYGAGVEQSDKLAFECYRKASEHFENIEGENLIKMFTNKLLADCYAQGKGVEKNEKLAAQYFQYIDRDKLNQKHKEATLALVMESTPKSRVAKEILPLRLAIHNSNKEYDSARQFVEGFYERIDGSDRNFKNICLKYIEQAEELDKKNQELEEKNKQLEKAKKELEDMMSMFAHKFRSPLDAIIYNTTHENQVKLYTEAAQTMRGLLDIFSIISTDPDVLNARLKQDNQGNSNLLTVLTKTLDMIMLHLLSASGTEKIQQHYMTYAKTRSLCDPELSYKSWYDDFFELEQQLQSEWEQSYAQLLTQSTGLEPRLAWLEQRFFKLELHGFDDADIHFKKHGVTESFLTILLNEILVNAFKYYSSSAKQPVVLEWISHNGFQVLTCRNQSVRSEREIYKGSKKGHHFLSVLARKTGSKFIEPILQDDFVVEFGIPNELLLNK